MDIISKSTELISFIFNGIGNFIDFILGLPSFIYSLIEVVPRPIYDIVLQFISIIIFIIVLYALGKVRSSA